MHAKYQCSIINTSEDMCKVKVFVTDGRTDKGTDRQTNEIQCPHAFAKVGDKNEKTFILVLYNVQVS